MSLHYVSNTVGIPSKLKLSHHSLQSTNFIISLTLVHCARRESSCTRRPRRKLKTWSDALLLLLLLMRFPAMGQHRESTWKIPKTRNQSKQKTQKVIPAKFSHLCSQFQRIIKAIWFAPNRLKLNGIVLNSPNTANWRVFRKVVYKISKCNHWKSIKQRKRSAQ